MGIDSEINGGLPRAQRVYLGVNKRYKSSSFLLDSNMEMRPYVVHRLLHQRARMRKPPSPPAVAPPPPIWEPNSDEYDTDLEDESQQIVDQKG